MRTRTLALVCGCSAVALSTLFSAEFAKLGFSNLLAAENINVGNLQQPATKEPEKPAPKPRPSIFDGLRQVIGDSPVFDDNEATEGLVESLDRAESIFSEIRQSNREAIRSMNRQQRIGRAKQAPHIILITVPQLRFDHLPQMGRLTGIQTSGMTFTNYYAAAEDLKTARWSLFTGQFAYQTPSDGAIQRSTSLAEYMWKTGYETTMIGTWANRQHPVELGFEHWTGFPTSSGVVEQHPEYFFTQSTKAKIIGDKASAQPTSLQLISDEVDSFLTRHQGTQRQFFLHIALPFVQGADPTNNIKSIDRAIGEVVDALNSLELAGRVCLMVTGETSHKISANVDQALPIVDEKLKYSESGLGEGNIRTPLIVFWGGTTKRGSVSHFPCTTVDILPTLMSLSQSQRGPRTTVGVSLTNELRGTKQNIERLLYWRMKDGSQVARRGRWKVVLPKGESELELYDLNVDSFEQKNVAKAHPEIVSGFIVNEEEKKPASTSTF